MHSICVGCLLGSALLWIGHWKARAPWMQSDRCRLVGASLLTACRQAEKQRLENSVSNDCKSDVGIQHVCLSPLHWPLTRHQSVYISYHESGVVNEGTILCRTRMFHQRVCIDYCHNGFYLPSTIIWFHNIACYFLFLEMQTNPWWRWYNGFSHCCGKTNSEYDCRLNLKS